MSRIVPLFAARPKTLRVDCANSHQTPTPRRGFLATLAAGVGLAGAPAVAGEWIVTPEEPGTLAELLQAARAAFREAEEFEPTGMTVAECNAQQNAMFERGSAAQIRFIRAIADAAGVDLAVAGPAAESVGNSWEDELTPIAIAREGAVTYMVVPAGHYEASQHSGEALGFSGDWRVRPIVIERSAARTPSPAVPPRLAHECQFHGSPTRLEVLPPGRDPGPLTGVEKLLGVLDLARGTDWRVAIIAMPFTQADEDASRKWASDRGYDPDQFCPRGSMAGQNPSQFR